MELLTHNSIETDSQLRILVLQQYFLSDSNGCMAQEYPPWAIRLRKVTRKRLRLACARTGWTQDRAVTVAIKILLAKLDRRGIGLDVKLSAKPKSTKRTTTRPPVRYKPRLD